MELNIKTAYNAGDTVEYRDGAGTMVGIIGRIIVYVEDGGLVSVYYEMLLGERITDEKIIRKIK